MFASAMFTVTGALYAIAAVLYFLLLTRGDARLGRWGARTLIAAAAAHVAFLVTQYAGLSAPPRADIYRTLSVAALLLVVAHLVTMRRPRMAVLGAFITPLTLLFFLGAGLRSGVGEVSQDVRSLLFPLHVGVNLVGVVAFALAAAAALAYLIQERQLRQKKLGGLFERLPSLDVLDSLALRLVTIGFPLLTIGIVTGSLWAARIETAENPTVMSPAEWFAALAWLIFATVLALRLAVGWRGRRAAMGTILGFGCALAVLVVYLVRASGGPT